MEQYAQRAHKIAYALSQKLGVPVIVRRMPLTKTLLGFEFVTGTYSHTYGQNFLEGNLAAFATRVLEGIQAHGTKKGHARHKSEGV
jgi:hypothetical protein